MSVNFPGTVIERNNKTAREFLFGVFAATKGLMLAQVREITGLDTSTIQNWVNRGWVKKPLNKRYTDDQLACIILINMLRDVMRLENITLLLDYLKAPDGSINIISETTIYNYVCDILDIIDYEILLSPKELENIIVKNIKGFKEPFPGAAVRLQNVLKIILVYYASAIVKREGDRIFTSVIEYNGSDWGSVLVAESDDEGGNVK